MQNSSLTDTDLDWPYKVYIAHVYYAKKSSKKLEGDSL